MRVQTANGGTTANYKTTMELHLPQGRTMTIDPYVLPRLETNLLAITDIIKQQGPVLFTEYAAYIIPPRLLQILKLDYKIATKTNDQYTICTGKQKAKYHTNRWQTITTRAAQAARTTSATTAPPPTRCHVPDRKTVTNTGKTNILATNDRVRTAFSGDDNLEPPQPTPSEATARLHKWHLILNHAAPNAIKQALKMHGHADADKISSHPITCTACRRGKLPRAPHRRITRDTPVGRIMCTDVCGPLHPTGPNNEKYFVTFMDVGSRYAFVIPIQRKAHVLQAVTAALAYSKKIRGDVPAIIHSDNAKEYVAHATIEAARQFGTTTSTTVPHNPEENGLAERLNRTIMDGVRCVLTAADMADGYWPAAIADVVFKQNLLIHAGTGQCPYRAWTGNVQPLPQMWAFGQLGWIPNLPHKAKLNDRGRLARYIGIEDVKHINVQTQNGTPMTIRMTDFHTVDKNTDPTQTTQNAYGTYTKKLRHRPDKIDIGTPPPVQWQQAMKYPDASEWRVAHDEALAKLDEEGVVDWAAKVPKCAKPLPLTMTYIYKWSRDGQECKRKARCSIRGDLMRPGQHFDPARTQCPTTEKATARLLFAIAAGHGWPIEHMDISNAYVHEPAMFQHPVYVKEIPLSDGTFRHGKRIGHLIKNLWGGKSAGHDYIMALFAHLKAHGYTATDGDPCLFTKAASAGPVLVAITVDDFLVTAPHTEQIAEFHKVLVQKYKVKRMGKPREFLGWSVSYGKDGEINIAQPALAQATLANASMSECNPRQTPYNNGELICPPHSGDTNTPQHHEKYRQLVGDLRYLADSTRPDLTFVTGKLGAALHQPTARHWAALKAVLRYLQHTLFLGITYTSGQKRAPAAKMLQCYTDASYAADTTDRKSTSGMLITYNGGPVAWYSRKQSLIAMSTAEAEYIAVAAAIQNANTMHRIMEQAGLWQAAPSTIKTDNKATVEMISKPHGTKRRKFIDLRHHYIRQQLDTGRTSVIHVPGQEQKADIMTKPLQRVAFQKQCEILHMAAMPQHHAAPDSRQPGGL